MNLIKKNSLLINLLLLIAVAWSAFSPNVNLTPDLFHDSELLLPAKMFQSGLLPFKDIYLQHGYLRNLIFPLLSFQILGESFSSILILEAVLCSLGAMGIAGILIVNFRGRYFLIVSWLLVLHLSYYEIFARQAFSICAVLCLLLVNNNLPVFSRKSKILATLSGLLSSLALMHSLEVGVYTISAEIIFLSGLFVGLRDRRYLEILKFILIGFAIMTGMFLLLFLMQGILFDFFTNCFNQIVYQGRIWSAPAPEFALLSQNILAGGVRLSPVALWFLNIFILGIAGVFLVTLAVNRKLLFRKERSGCLLLIILILLFSRSAFGRSDMLHLRFSQLYTPLFLASIFFLTFNWSVLRTDKLKLVSKYLLLTIIALILVAGFQPGFRARLAEAPSQEFNLTLQKKIDFLRNELQFLQAEDSIYILSNQGSYYYYLNRFPASKFFNPIYAAVPQLDMELQQDLKHAMPKIVMFDVSDGLHQLDGQPIQQRIPQTIRWLDSNYVLSKQSDGISLYVPRPSVASS